jgi:hypothetical protein
MSTYPFSQRARLPRSGCNPSLQNHYVGERHELKPKHFQDVPSSTTSGVFGQMVQPGGIDQKLNKICGVDGT